MTEETRGPGGGYGQDVMNTQNACKKHAHKLELDSDIGQSKQKKLEFSTVNPAQLGLQQGLFTIFASL